jgi:hypothetical protein
VLLHPPHWPFTHRSGAQSLFCVHARPHVPDSAPVQVCEPPQFSLDTQPHVPPLQIPLAQSVFWAHVGAWHDPPQRLPAPQSALEAQALALHIVLLHLAPATVPQSVLTEQVAGGVHLTPEHAPVGQSVSTLHFDVLHLALLQSALTVQEASPAQLWVVHLAPVHSPLDGHAASPAQVAGVLHLALLQV